jgi:GNAT superfamily N-acetyltransferase
MIPLHHETQFTFRFGDDRIIPRFHLEGIEAGRMVSVFKIDADSGERQTLMTMATVGEGGWVDLPEPIVVRAGDAFVAVPEERDPRPLAVIYKLEPDLTPEEFVDVLMRSTLAERRPVDDPPTIQAMLENAGLILTARIEGKLVGVARAITDFAYCTYLSDLAVDECFQRQGIGRELIRRTHEAAGLHTTLILLSAPKAESYYSHIGMAPHGSCWIVQRRPR